ncbi:hypothetical protein H0H92_011049, partial [Tricholoma furcatifolium]
RQTILDWVRYGITTLSKEISRQSGKNTPSASVFPDQPALPWKDFYARFLKEKETLAYSPDHDLLSRQEACRSYLNDIERILVARGAKTWNNVYPDKPSVPSDDDAPEGESLTPGYSFLSTSYYRSPFSESLESRYAELYEACFAGDNQKIEQMCLPKEQEHAGPPPLSIFAEVTDKAQRWLKTGKFKCHTPLFAAICGRRWMTSKLIMAIAAAQYKPPANEEKFSTKGIFLYDEDQASDDGSEASDDSNATAGPREEAKFIDIAKRVSSIETDIHPKFILDEANVSWVDKTSDGKYSEVNGNLLFKAIHDGDYEAFINIIGLYTSSPIPIACGNIVEHIVKKDQVEMLDYYIRQTGQGVEIALDHSEAPSALTNDSNKIYLGLNVHGKKRSDLAKKNDPNATQDTVSVLPLVWIAAESGAKSVVEYLAGPRPL